MPIDKLTQQHRDERRRAGQTNSLLRGLGKTSQRPGANRARAKRLHSPHNSTTPSPFDPDECRYGLAPWGKSMKQWD